MKRTWRSMLSMVLVASLLLSMVIVSGLSVSAANARVQYITGNDILYSGNDIGCIPADLTTEGNSWTLSLTGNCNTTAGSVVAAVILGEPSVLQDLPYLVIDVDKSSTLNNSWLAWTETSGYVWPFGSWGANTGLMVYDMSQVVKEGETFTLQLWGGSLAGATYKVNSMYLTDVDPTAVPEEPGTEANNIPLASFAPGYNNTNMSATGDDGLGLSLASPWTDATGYGYTYWNITTPQIAETPYLVIQNSAETYGNIGGFYALTYGWLGTVLQALPGTDLQVIDLRTFDDGASALCLCYTMTGDLKFDKAYLTDTDPTALPPAEVTEVLMSDWKDNPYINVPREVYGTSGKGVSLSSQWTDATGYGYWYPHISGAQIAETPYLVIKPAASTLSAVGGWFHITDGGNMWAALHAFENSNTMQVVDLRTLTSTAGDGGLYILMTYGGQRDFTMFYLTSDASSVVDEADPTAEAIHMKDMGVNLGNVTPNASGDFGITYPFDPAVAGDQFAYYNQLPSFEEFPYLIYKLADGSEAGAVMHVAQNTWWTDFVTLPTASTEHTVVNLKELACYAPGNTMLLQTLFSATTEFEYFCFATSADYVPAGSGSEGGDEGDEEEPTVFYYVNFVTNGGSGVYTQLVPAEGTVDAVESYKTGYVLEGWYTDSALTQPFDFSTVVTADMTLYAKWAIADVVSPLFAQLQTGVTAESSSASIRFVAAIDSLEALEVGFVFSLTSDDPTVGGEYCTAFQTNTVWNAINAGGAVVTAEDLHGTYIFGCTITNIPKTRFSSDIYVKGYVKQMDGTYVYTDVKTYSVSGMLG